MRVPSLHMTIDETLFPYPGHISIKNYNPNKPARYGLLVISISDAEVPYTYYRLPYAGKPEIPNEYYVQGPDEKSMYLVTKLRLYCDLTGRNISMDRYFTSLSIADWLLGRNMAAVGTMKDNRVGIPQTLRHPHGRDVRSTISMYNSDNGKKDARLVGRQEEIGPKKYPNAHDYVRYRKSIPR